MQWEVMPLMSHLKAIPEKFEPKRQIEIIFFENPSPG